MAAEEHLYVNALPNTIMYSIDSKKTAHDYYKLKMLTYVDEAEKLKHTMNFRGNICSAGHVLLTYPSGGTILTSMGHWSEMMNLETSEKQLFEVAQQEYGQEYVEQMRD